MAVICLGIFGMLLFAPEQYLQVYGVDDGIFMVRRVSPMFLGFAILLWSGRDAMPSPLRHGVALGMATAFGGIACTGMHAWWTGDAGPAIIIAVVIEIYIAITYIKTTTT